MQFFAENPTHCLNPARPPRWYQRHSPGQRAAMKGDWEEYRGWDWKKMPLPYPPMYNKKKRHSRKGGKCWGRRKGKRVTMAPKDTVVYTPVYYPGMADGRYNPQEQAEAANLHQYGRQARAEQQAYLEQQAQIHAILQQQHAQAMADRQAYIQYLRETESERQEYMEREAEAAHAEYLRSTGPTSRSSRLKPSTKRICSKKSRCDRRASPRRRQRPGATASRPTTLLLRRTRNRCRPPRRSCPPTFPRRRLMLPRLCVRRRLLNSKSSPSSRPTESPRHHLRLSLPKIPSLRVTRPPHAVLAGIRHYTLSSHFVTLFS